MIVPPSRTKVVLIALVAALIIGTIFYFLSREGEPLTVTVQTPEPEPTIAEKVIGRSVEGRAITAYTYGEGETNLLFVGGIHGGYEWNSILLAYGMMDYLAENPDVIPEDLSVTIVPNANPDGLFKVVGVEGRFSATDVREVAAGVGRFNANEVDLNRNFDCKWQPESTWQSKTVSAGTEAFSEPESRAIRDVVDTLKPVGVVFWHSQANAVYASECEAGILPGTLTLMSIYAGAAGYPSVESFEHYVVTGDAEGWLASINIPAITVELSTHTTIEWEKNLAGVKALFAHYGRE